MSKATSAWTLDSFQSFAGTHKLAINLAPALLFGSLALPTLNLTGACAVPAKYLVQSIKLDRN